MTVPDSVEWSPEPQSVEIQSVGFEDGGISITYVEEHDISPDVMVVKNVVIRRTALRKEEYEDLLDTLRQWVDEALVLVRQHRNR